MLRLLQPSLTEFTGKFDGTLSPSASKMAEHGMGCKRSIIVSLRAGIWVSFLSPA
ncbi:hypothetical protein [Polluticoccus soli]|uniref:hypothetical protein n=1 Tax=Polluticoccus soli TaxID=3034150 RepID=UPI0023E13DC7|nr:hypothetical protein [Flavipsychrobacter sp. JY13-12]